MNSTHHLRFKPRVATADLTFYAARVANAQMSARETFPLERYQALVEQMSGLLQTPAAKRMTVLQRLDAMADFYESSVDIYTARDDAPPSS